MFNRTDFSKLGGLHTYQDTLENLQNAYSGDADAVAKFIGEHYVITGCVDDGVNVSNGWIVVNGEKVPFVGGVKQAWIVMEDILGDESFDNGTLQTIYFTRRAKFGIASGGPDDFQYSQLKRLPYDATSIGEYAATINSMLQAVLQKEPEVILDGCIVSNITAGPNSCDISSGLVLFNGKLIRTPSRIGGVYPAYLKEDGTWTDVLPGAGLYITFDPHTSQRYIDVLDRALTKPGTIKMFKTLSDRFNLGSGLGKWEHKGYKLVYELQNRVPMGLWFDGIAEANVSDAAHAGVGNAVGEKAHALTGEELPKLDPASLGLVKNNGLNTFLTGDANAGEFDNKESFLWPGNDVKHENRQPSRIIVYAERL